jgi:hypothetical protein
MSNNDLKEKLADTAEKAKVTANAALDAATEAGRAAKAEMKARATQTLGAAREAASDRADLARDTLVGAGERLTEALQAEAGNASGVSQRVLTGLADGVATATEGLRGRTLGDLIADAQSYARRHPGAFAVGAAVGGFALARFLRASADRRQAEFRANETADRLYRDAARRTAESLGRQNGGGPTT